jgi:hypothetical protein
MNLAGGAAVINRVNSGISKSAERLLARLASKDSATEGRFVAVGSNAARSADAEILISNDLAGRHANGNLEITAAGRSHLARLEVARSGSEVDPFLAQHLELSQRELAAGTGRARVRVDTAESPLVWLARRKGRDGRALIEPVQLQAGERLRADFTRAQLMPRVTANWTSSVAQDRRAGGVAAFNDAVIAARQQIRQACDSVGPEFIGLLLDVCCFLKSLEDVERERRWPARSAKVVLQLALDRLARHYGYAAEARGKKRAAVRTWLAPDAAFVLGE